MPHLRFRILTKVLLASVKHSPVISVFGQRQSGKTTLLKNIANSTNSFDNPQWVKTVSEQGTAILDSLKKPALLDEAQKYPPIFDLVKLKVDETRRPGQFLLTGSVRFSKKIDSRVLNRKNNSLGTPPPHTFRSA